MHYAIARAVRRFRLLVNRRSFERDLEDELRFHMDMATSRHVAHGMRALDARALTRREFGSMDRFKDEVRDARGLTISDDVGRDLRFAARTLRRTPGFTAIALLTFALGIGANTAIFSIVNAVLLRPLPYPNADRLVRVYEILKDDPRPGSVSVMNWYDWRRQAASFAALGGYSASGGILGGEGEPERVRVGYVSAEVLPMLGVRPARGRLFLKDEDVKGKHRVVVLSDALWRRRFGADSSIVGRSIPLEGTPYVVVGVMPPSFNFPAGPVPMDLWAPFVPPDQALDPRSRGWHWMSVVGLLKPGVTLTQADAEMKQIARRLELEYPGPQVNRSATTLTMHEALVGDVRPVLLVLLGAVFLVLLIACANVANLLLARNATRQKEIAVRIALGAGRGHIGRQLLAESLLLALGGALLGLGVARLALSALTAVGSDLLRVGGSILIDGRVLLTLLAAALACGIAFGIAPVFQRSPAKMRASLAGLTVKTTSSSEVQRFRSGLVIAQVALSLMLLVGAGLLLRAFVALQSTDPGLRPERVLTARLAVPRHFARENTETEQVLRPVLESVRGIPGVSAAGITSLLPIEETGAMASFWIDRRPWPKPGSEPMVEVRGISPGYFATMGVPIIAGRDLQEQDDSTGGSKVVVNEAVVRRFFSGENPIGRKLLQGSPQQHDEYEIVGVVRDVKQSGLDVPPRPEMYSSYADKRASFAVGDVALAIKTSVPELSIVPQVRRVVAELARGVALTNVRPMEEVIEHSLADRRLTLTLFLLFAGVALALALSGLYGVIYYLVTQRTREIGIRVALGADQSRVVRLVLGQGALLAAVGIVIGLAGALALSRLLGGLLYGVSARDPITFTGVSVLLALVALLATLIPAWKAAKVDPIIALRAE